jgi:drug/metabolite transporter (DMT)-like permease
MDQRRIRTARQPAGPPGQRAAAAGTASGLVAVTMWGLAPVATRALVLQLAPLPLLMLRVALAAVVLLPVAAPALRRFERAQLPRLAAAGVLGMVGYNLPVTLGLRWVPASTAALILATEPIWILALSRLFLAERVPRLSWGGAAVAVAGVAVLAGPEAFRVGAGSRTLAGIGLILLGTALFGAYTIVLRPLAGSYGAVPATAASTVIGSVPYAAFAGLVHPAQLAGLPATAWGELVFLALGSTVVGLLLWSLAVVRAGATRAGLLLYLEPLIGVAGAAAFLGEGLSAADIAGGALIMGGVVIAWLAQRRRGAAPDDGPDDDGPGRAPEAARSGAG